MRNLGFVVVGLIIGLLSTGCASKGFNRGELREQAGVIKPVFDEKEIKEAYTKKGNLPKPFKIAVYFKAPKGRFNAQNEWRWTEQDKTALAEIAKELKGQGVVSDIFPLVGSVVEDDSLKLLRLVAAKHQADALLIVTGAGQIDRYINGWGWSYALLAPTLFVPGSVADTLFMTNASLWDVKNEFLYLTAESEATTSEKYVAAFGKQDKELLDEAKSQSLTKLKDELKKQIQGTKL